MTARVVKVETGFAIQVVRLTDPATARRRPVADTKVLHAAEHRMELRRLNPERVMLPRELFADAFEQHGRAVAQSYGQEDALRLRWSEPQDTGEELGGFRLVAGEDELVVQRGAAVRHGA